MSGIFENWRQNFPSWLDGQGPAADIVVATKASLARNLAGFSFPIQAKQTELASVQMELDKVLPSALACPAEYSLELAQLTTSERGLLQEKQMISHAAVQAPMQQIMHASANGHVWGLVNGEDHLLLEAMESGFDPKKPLESLMATESGLETELPFAYREDLGYLTSRPGNVGCGMRLSALVHLPGLVMVDEIDKILNAMRQLRFSVLGLFGSGQAVRGAIFRITSLVTLGRDEEEIADDFSYHVGKILLHEKSAREQLYARDKQWLEDQILRSYAILRSAKMITAQETMDCLSQLRLGVGLEIVPGIPYSLLNELLLGHQSSHLELKMGTALDNREKTLHRASFLQDRLGTI